MALMEDYARDVKDGNFITKFPTSQHTTQVAFKAAKYVGSDRCAGCHKEAFKIWEKTPHAQAFETLVKKAQHPSLRQFDGECVACHVTGFNYTTGYADALRANDKPLMTKLQEVGCESCHGPGSEHVAAEKANAATSQQLRAMMNSLWKGMPEKIRMSKIDQFCQKCHDIDNDVHWNFAKNWPKIVHMNPGNKAAPVAAPVNPAPGANAAPPTVQTEPTAIPAPEVGPPALPQPK
jgi:hypothetical protein